MGGGRDTVHPGEGRGVQLPRGVSVGNLFVVGDIKAIIRQEKVGRLHCWKRDGEGVGAPFRCLTAVLKSFIVLPPNNIVSFSEKDGDGIEMWIRIPFPHSLLPHVVNEALQAEDGSH